MTRRLLSLFILASLVVAVMAITSQAYSSAKVGKTETYGFSSSSSSQKSSPATSLGTHSADGGSPGYIIGRSMRDDQAHLSPGHFVDWRTGPQIHFIYAAQYLAGHDDAGVARWIEYTMFDPTLGENGVFLTPVMIENNPLSRGGWYPNMDVDETGHVLPVGDEFNPADPVRHSTVFWDVAGAGAYGAFVADPLPQTLSLDPDEFIMYPKIEYQDFGGQYITHVLVNEDQTSDAACDNNAITYWRRVASAAGPTGAWTTQVVDDAIWTNHFDISAARGGSGNAAIVWIHWPGYCDGAGGDDEGQIWIQESVDAGASWGTAYEIVDTTDANEYHPWVDVDCQHDSEGFLHVVWNAGIENNIDPHRLFHWSNRVAGPDAGGTTSLVHIADFRGLTPMCGRGSYNVGNTAKASISECNEKLYVSWVQYGNYDDGDTTDCAVDDLAYDHGVRYNADLFMSVASDLDGLLWDAARNLTNSKTPDCDSTVANNCDSDNYGNMSRYGMWTGSFGETNWSAVPEAFQVRDALVPTWPDTSWYIDYWFVNDLMGEPARYLDNPEEAIWTYNPIKWFRLPCVDPVIEPRINISQDDLIHPMYWIKNGATDNIDLVIENIGNAELTVSAISTNVTQGTGWLSVSPPSMLIPPASAETAILTIDASGFAAGTTTAIEGEVVISSNDADGDLTFLINTVVSDTVVVPTWDTITTGLPTSLIVSTHGNAGFGGEGEVNLDWVGAGDCDTTQSVYLFDLTPVIFQAQDNYSYQPFWNGTNLGTGPENFQPVSDAVPPSHEVTADYDMFTTGTFVTSDSAIGSTKYWVAPTDEVAFVLERWDIYSYDGASHTGVRLGEWIDWDAPSGTNGNDGGTVVNTDHVDYVYQQGKVDLTATPAPCIGEDTRFCATGLLGHFTRTELAADENANNTGLYGGFILLDDALFVQNADDFIPDSAWSLLNTAGLSADNSEDDDQQAWLSFGTFDILAGDTLTIWTVHATVYDGDEDVLQATIDSAETWYNTNRSTFHPSGCCGLFTDGVWLPGYTGNTNCSDDGKRTLSDITKLIDNVYISKEPLCCYASGNTNGSWDDGECKITLSDITKLIDAVYISKEPTEPCNSGCER